MATAMVERGFEVVVAGQVRDGFGPTPPPLDGMRLVELPPVSGRSPRGLSSQIRVVRRLLREVRPDVTHAHWLCGYGAVAALAGARPLVSTAWGSDVLLATPAQRLANRVAVRRSARLTADAVVTCEAMVALGAPRDRVEHITWGVDLERFGPATDRASVRAALGLPAGPLVLSPRSILPLYNPRVVVDSFARIAERIPDAQLVMLTLVEGDHDLGPLPVRDRIHVIGRVPYRSMPDYLRAADVCVSIPSSDGAPRTIWEAMACGTPTVLSDLPWLDGELDSNTDALVVPIDADAVADAVTELLTDARRAEAIAASGRRLVLERHDARREMDRLARLLRQVAVDARGVAGRIGNSRHHAPFESAHRVARRG